MISEYTKNVHRAYEQCVSMDLLFIWKKVLFKTTLPSHYYRVSHKNILLQLFCIPQDIQKSWQNSRHCYISLWTFNWKTYMYSICPICFILADVNKNKTNILRETMWLDTPQQYIRHIPLELESHLRSIIYNDQFNLSEFRSFNCFRLEELIKLWGTP